MHEGGSSTTNDQNKLLEHEVFALWHVNDLEFQEYLLYNLICGYFILDPNTYGHIELEARCIGVHVLHYCCKLVIVYHEYSGQQKTVKLKGPTFVMEYPIR
jgi:hypothetical protein